MPAGAAPRLRRARRSRTRWWSRAGSTVLGTPIDLSSDHRRLLPRRRASPTTSRRGRTRYRDAAARLRAALRALHERPHRGDGQPARQREGELPRQRRAARGRRTSGSTSATADARAPGGTTGRRGSASARAHEKHAPQEARRRGAQAARRRARHVRAASRPAPCRTRSAAAALLRAQRERRAAAADHRLHDQLGGLRARSSPLYERALRVHPLRPPRLGPLGAPLRPTSMPELAGDAVRLLDALGIESAHVYGALDGRDDRPGAGASASRSACAGWCWAARRRAGRARCGRRWRAGALGAAPPARCASRAAVAGACCSRPSSGASSPSACASCCATSPPPRDAARRCWAHWWATRLPRHGLAARRDPGADAGAARRARRDGAARQRAAARRADPRRRAGDRARARATRTRSSAPRSRSTLLADWLDRRAPIAAGRAAHRAWRRRRAAHPRARAADRAAAHRSEPRRARRASECRERRPMWRLTDEQRELREEIRDGRARGDPRRACSRSTRTASTRATSTTAAGASTAARARASRASTAGAASPRRPCCAYVEELAKVSGTVSLMAAYVKLVVAAAPAGGQPRSRSSACCPGCCAGEMLGSYALTEPDVGLGPGARCRRAPSGAATCWVLNGEKRFIGNAGLSATSTSCSRAPATPGRKGVSAFVVDGDVAGRLRRAAADDGHAGLAARRAALRGRRGAGREPARATRATASRSRW